jgi:hypothetical protein
MKMIHSAHWVDYSFLPFFTPLRLELSVLHVKWSAGKNGKSLFVSLSGFPYISKKPFQSV